MRTKFSFTLPILGLACAVGLLFFVPLLDAQHQHDEHDHMQNDTHDKYGHSDMAKGQKIRCAFDGMMMKASTMIEVKHKGKTHYFCNQQQAEIFEAHPDRYLKQIPMGHLNFNLNVLTVDEYKTMMESMGMAEHGMMKIDAMKEKTHRISVYTTQHNRDISLGDIELALQITDATGKTDTTPLKYNKMMKTYDGYVAMPSAGKHQVRVLVTTPGVSVSM